MHKTSQKHYKLFISRQKSKSDIFWVYPINTEFVKIMLFLTFALISIFLVVLGGFMQLKSNYNVALHCTRMSTYEGFLYLQLERASPRSRRFEFYISAGDPGAGVYRYSKVKHVYLWKQITFMIFYFLKLFFFQEKNRLLLILTLNNSVVRKLSQLWCMRNFYTEFCFVVFSKMKIWKFLLQSVYNYIIKLEHQSFKKLLRSSKICDDEKIPKL